jgi:CheY-like chemotaxis protein
MSSFCGSRPAKSEFREQPFPEIPHLSCTREALDSLANASLEWMQGVSSEEWPEVQIRVLVVDDSAAIRQAVRSCIVGHAELEFCGEAENGDVALDMVRKLNPDIVVLDLMMPGLNGFEVAREIGTSAPHTRIIMFTANDCEGLIREAQNVGISRVIAKSGDGVATNLVAAIRELYHGRDAASI